MEEVGVGVIARMMSEVGDWERGIEMKGEGRMGKLREVRKVEGVKEGVGEKGV